MPAANTPYHPITPELSASGLLIPIKEAAAAEGACESSLKTNAKARRLPAYQAHFGAPVMVRSSEVQAFLKARPDIASKYHPKGSLAVQAAGHPPTAAKPETGDEPCLPQDDGSRHQIGELGIAITLRSLVNSLPSERALVAKCLMEIASQINSTLPTDSGNQNQH